MKELLLRIEEASQAAGIGPLVIVGLIATGVGLFLWLGGARYSWVVAGLLGIFVGLGIGTQIVSVFDLRPMVGMTLGVVLTAILAIILRRAIIFILAVIIFAILSGTGYLGSALDDPQLKERLSGIRQRVSAGKAQILDEARQEVQRRAEEKLLDQIINDEEMKSETQPTAKIGFQEKFNEIWQDLQPFLTSHRGRFILWCLGGAVVGLILIKLLKRAIMALCCSIVGTAATIFGVLVLMMAKRADVTSYLEMHSKMVMITFLGMILFGWVVQLLISRPLRRVSTQEE